MGTCCDAHLTTKVRGYAPNAQNGAVTVNLIDRTQYPPDYLPLAKCDYCNAPAEFVVSYYPK